MSSLSEESIELESRLLSKLITAQSINPPLIENHAHNLDGKSSVHHIHHYHIDCFNHSLVLPGNGSFEDSNLDFIRSNISDANLNTNSTSLEGSITYSKMYTISFDDLITELKDPTKINQKSSTEIGRSSVINKPLIINPTRSVSHENFFTSTMPGLQLNSGSEMDGNEDESKENQKDDKDKVWGIAVSTPVMDSLPFLNQNPIQPTLISTSSVITPTQISSRPAFSSSPVSSLSKLQMPSSSIHHSHHIHHHHLAEGRFNNSQSSGASSNVTASSVIDFDGHQGNAHPGHQGSHHPHEDSHHNEDKVISNKTDVDAIKNVNNNAATTRKPSRYNLDEFLDEEGKVIIPNKDTNVDLNDDSIINYNSSHLNFSPSSKHDDGSSSSSTTTPRTPTQVSKVTKVPAEYSITSDKSESDSKTKEDDSGIVTTPSTKATGYHHDEDHHHVPNFFGTSTNKGYF